MDDILSYLEDLTHLESYPPEYFALARKLDPIYQIIKEKLSLEVLDQLSDARSDVSIWENKEAFSRGFRLGVQLTLAGLQPFSS